MSNSFEVVSDIAEIGRLNTELGRQLAKTFRVKRTREITYPSNHHTGTVFFESANGTGVRAWSPYIEDKKLGNFLLSGDPEATEWMQIDVQLNFPSGTYNRLMAGAFVIDENGDIFVAHRGKLTKGKAGLKKAKVFREFAARTIDAKDLGQTSRLILISALDDPALADRMWQFAVEAREAATRIAAEHDSDAEPDSPSAGDKPNAIPAGRRSLHKPKDHMLKLKAYFDEYAGEGHTKGYGGGKRTVEHGDVVKALEALLSVNGTSQKAQAIDLAIVTREVDLYEIKTSARTTDVYTGVGQLLIHGECIHEMLGLPVRRHLVVPALPRDSHGKHITHKIGINIVTFVKNGEAYRFSGLP